MKIVRDPESLTKALAPARRRSSIIGLVPTMGALHEGHQQLVQECRSASDVSVVSIFVNPMQFETAESFKNYPRRAARDLKMLRSMNVDIAYCPADPIYPSDVAVRLTERTVSPLYEGAVRPGHFEGVLTIVAKLFLHARPSIAFFGEKDFQQLWLVRRLTSELAFGVRVVGVPTVRDPRSGLACSSRNERLSGAGRIKASVLYRAMSEAASLPDSGRGRTARSMTAHVVRLLRAQSVRPRYVAVIRESDFGAVTGRIPAREPCRMVASVDIEGVHLIDNIPLKA